MIKFEQSFLMHTVYRILQTTTDYRKVSFVVVVLFDSSLSFLKAVFLAPASIAIYFSMFVTVPYCAICISISIHCERTTNVHSMTFSSINAATSNAMTALHIWWRSKNDAIFHANFPCFLCQHFFLVFFSLISCHIHIPFDDKMKNFIKHPFERSSSPFCPTLLLLRRVYDVRWMQYERLCIDVTDEHRAKLH